MTLTTATNPGIQTSEFYVTLLTVGLPFLNKLLPTGYELDDATIGYLIAISSVFVGGRLVLKGISLRALGANAVEAAIKAAVASVAADLQTATPAPAVVESTTVTTVQSQETKVSTPAPAPAAASDTVAADSNHAAVMPSAL